MVKEENLSMGKVFICQKCGFNYKEKQWTERCENWCKEHHSCNIEITKHAIDISNG